MADLNSKLVRISDQACRSLFVELPSSFTLYASESVRFKQGGLKVREPSESAIKYSVVQDQSVDPVFSTRFYKNTLRPNGRLSALVAQRVGKRGRLRDERAILSSVRWLWYSLDMVCTLRTPS